MATQTRPSAVLWDYDGTLLDTEPVWIRSEIAVMASYGADWTYEQGVKICGVSASTSSKILLDTAAGQLGRRPDVDPEHFWSQVSSAVQQYVEEQGPPWRPGAQELVHALFELDVPMALVSASPRSLLEAGLNQMTPDLFSTVISGPEMPRSKPAPDSYLMAADRLDVDPHECIVIEDSVSGVTAGRAAGAVVIAVPCMHPLPTATGQVNLDSLAGITPADLTRIWHQVRGLPHA